MDSRVQHSVHARTYTHMSMYTRAHTHNRMHMRALAHIHMYVYTPGGVLVPAATAKVGGETEHAHCAHRLWRAPPPPYGP